MWLRFTGIRCQNFFRSTTGALSNLQSINQSVHQSINHIINAKPLPPSSYNIKKQSKRNSINLNRIHLPAPMYRPSLYLNFTTGTGTRPVLPCSAKRQINYCKLLPPSSYNNKKQNKRTSINQNRIHFLAPKYTLYFTSLPVPVPDRSAPA